MSAGFRSGFVSLVGRPNVGKSTLLNQLLRKKVSIVSSKPQTTRTAVRGVLTAPGSQIVFVDTPGLHKPRTALGESLNRVVRATARDVDVLVLVLDASKDIGRGDAFVAGEIGGGSVPVIVALNKIDVASDVGRQRDAARELGPWPVLAVSARTGAGTAELVETITAALPDGPMYYPPDQVTDQPLPVLVAELVREKLVEMMRDEVPHSIAVVTDELAPREASDVVDIRATVYVERSSQKGIVIGSRGSVLKEAGTRARKDIEAHLGRPVFLELRVKVEPDWQRRRQLVERFGYGT